MGEEERPTEEQLREAKRDVLLHCIYGVDLNPMALELAQVQFVDHRFTAGHAFNLPRPQTEMR